MKKLLGKYEVEIKLINGTTVYGTCNAETQFEADRLVVNELENRDMKFEHVLTSYLGVCRDCEKGYHPSIFSNE
jgi:hypothetical protein